MSPIQALLLLALSAIWGSSFMFMRYLSPIVGPVLTADMRMLIAGIFLLVFFAATGFRLGWRRNWRRFIVIGLVNSGLPFLLFSFAALYVPASVESVLNALSPLFGAIFSAIWLSEALTARKIAGLVIGASGVATITSFGSLPTSPMLLPAILACVLATACYGLCGVYIKKRAADLAPRAMAAGSQFAAGIIILPLTAAFPLKNAPGPAVLSAIVAFALLCSAVAYLIYYKLLSELGPTKALTVTFLIPVFGMLWGSIMLAERISLAMIGGAALVLAGTGLVALKGGRKSPAQGGSDRASR
jgi:drug/metabolite transporter (DMT)-like permease